jgi:GT2 family glycosyltransferase
LPQPTISVVIVSYNTRDMTLECLRSVFDQTDASLDVIVVDNASTDGSPDAIRAQYPQVTVLAEPINHGFGPAHQIAMQYAKAPWVLLLNPDTEILDGAIDKLLAFARRMPGAGIWGGRTIYADGSLNKTSCWRKMTPWSLLCRITGLTSLFSRSALFNCEEYAGWQRDTERNVDIVTGCFLLMRRTLWDDLRGFDPTFYMYGEEADLCIRAKALGCRPSVTPEAQIIHHGGQSDPMATERTIKVLRAKTELILRHFPSGLRRACAVLHMCFPLSRLVGARVLQIVAPAKDRSQVADYWSKIWSRRAEWRYGFRAQPSQPLQRLVHTKPGM